MTTLDQQQPQQQPQSSDQSGQCNSRINVGPVERVVSLVSGAGLVGMGLRMRSLPGVLVALAGGVMLQRGASGHCPMYQALNINKADTPPADPSDHFEHGIHVEESVTVNRPTYECFAFWRNFENLPKFTHYLQSVRCFDNNRSHWVTRAPAGMSVEWDAEIMNEEDNALIAWRSLGNADVDNAGSVRFLPTDDGRSTLVKVVIEYIPPAGRFGQAVTKIFGQDPQAQVREDLRRFKQIMETGDLAAVESTSHAAEGESEHDA